MYAMKMLRCYSIVAHVYDELIIEADKRMSLDAVCEQMGRTPPWAEGLLLRADGYETDFTRKTESFLKTFKTDASLMVLGAFRNVRFQNISKLLYFLLFCVNIETKEVLQWICIKNWLLCAALPIATWYGLPDRRAQLYGI